MPTRFTLPHIDISGRYTSGDYTGEGSGRSNNVRIREEHGARLQRELDAALAMIDEQRVLDDRLPPVTGGYVEVELRRGADPDKLERSRENGGGKLDHGSGGIVSLRAA